MSKDFYVYSTMSAGNTYTVYDPNVEKGQLPRIIGQVDIAGGANVAKRRSLETPLGVARRITADQYELLKQDPVFQTHVKGGYIRVIEAKVDPEKVVPDMTQRDESAPLVPEDFEKTVDADGAKHTKMKRKPK